MFNLIAVVNILVGLLFVTLGGKYIKHIHSITLAALAFQILQGKLIIAFLASAITYLICYKLTPSLRGLTLGL